MNQFERMACFAGGILLAFAAAVMLRGRGMMQARPARHRRGEPPVEELAGKLQEAWAEHHTRA